MSSTISIAKTTSRSDGYLVLGSINLDAIQRLQGIQSCLGGKSANIARMLTTLSNKEVHFAGKTGDAATITGRVLHDLLNFDAACKKLHLHIKCESGLEPGFAVIGLNQEGDNEIDYYPYANEHFRFEDVPKEWYGRCKTQVLTLEMPYRTALAAAQFGKEKGLTTYLDIGGIKPRQNIEEILSCVELVKPNEVEARIVTGIEITGEKTAQKAADYFHKRGIPQVVITAGKRGTYYSTTQIDSHKNTSGHVNALVVEVKNPYMQDSIGCGDQTMAALVYALEKNKDIESAVRYATVAGAVQFTKMGAVPVTREEIRKMQKRCGVDYE